MKLYHDDVGMQIGEASTSKAANGADADTAGCSKGTSKADAEEAEDEEEEEDEEDSDSDEVCCTCGYRGSA